MKITEFRKLIREEVRKVIKEEELEEAKVAILTITLTGTRTNDGNMATFSGPYKYSKNPQKFSIFNQDSAAVSEETLPPYISAHTAYRAQPANGSKFELELVVPHTDFSTTITAFKNLIKNIFKNETLEKDVIKISSEIGGDDFGGTFKNTKDLKNILLSVVSQSIEGKYYTAKEPKFVTTRSGKNFLPYEVDIVWRKNGYFIEYKDEDPDENALTFKETTDMLKKVFAEIQSSLQAKLVGQPQTYESTTGFTRFDSEIDVVGIEFKTSLSFDEMRKLYPQNTVNMR